ncbi:MAG: L-serine ammonia-lyase, iron-sulfur-dependent, subunit alpha [Lachnospiraceae bacterium]|nr:L-serine ammonia-lyase, iron-sulfur-dependent, subunit alpha [Lachnospiraceae bacterium]
MYRSMEEITHVMEKTGMPFWQVVQEEDCKETGVSAESSFTRMTEMLKAMKASDAEYDAGLKSASGLVGTDGEALRRAKENGTLMSGEFIGTVMEKAMRIAESNACMKRIVAAPTAGSCGVLPAVILSLQETLHIPDEEMVKALYVAAGVGGVIAERASLSGAAGGCQAEIGAASSMAAAAMVFLRGGNAKQMDSAAAIALKGLLGLVCDPVAGLVEVPCVKRNVIGAVNAVTSADMALAGIESRIPADEVFDAMRSVGRCMHEELRETGKGGLAATPTGLKVKENFK